MERTVSGRGEVVAQAAGFEGNNWRQNTVRKIMEGIGKNSLERRVVG